MKASILIMLLLLGYTKSVSQTVNLFNQNDVNNFATTYPGDNSFESISISGADITNLNGLSQVTELTGDLYIYSPTNGHPLTDISGLNNINTIDGRLSLVDLPNLNATNLFPNLLRIGLGAPGNGLFISGLTPATISGFNTLANVSGDLAIQNTSALVSLNGFSSLTKVKSIVSNNQASFYFLDNSALASINGFYSLNEIGWEYYFVNNPNLIALPNTPNLSIIGKSITLWNDNAITNFNGLNGLTTMGGGINVNNNANLVSCFGLNNLTVTNGINLLNNPALASLTDLANLSTFPSLGGPIRPFITISNNITLSSLTGLDHINGATIGQVVLENNPNLSICAIESFCEKIAFDTNLLGFTQVGNNATNCNSADDINTACQLLSTTEMEATPSIFIYPNPVKSVLHVNTSAPTKIIISDVVGRIRIHTMVENGTVDVSRLEKGIYFMQATVNKQRLHSKWIKE